MTTQDHLLAMGACFDARQFASGYDNWRDIINNCDRPDWLLWLSDRLGILNDKECRLLACYFVRSTPLADGRKVWDLLTDERSRNAVLVAERYANGRATNEERAAAWAAAWAALAAARAAWAARGAALAARAAAGDAALAAGDAALAAARDAALAAARDAALAAGDAAWAAALAARDAALAAAWAHQARYIRKKYGKRIITTMNEKCLIAK